MASIVLIGVKSVFRQLDYQERVIATLDTWLDHLKEEKANADEVAILAEKNPEVDIPTPDFTRNAWEKMKENGHLPKSRAEIPFSSREDGCMRPVPNAVLKVPTGGGKTWLAINSISHIMNRYLNRNKGFILWIVPNEAIYSQTLEHFRDRNHIYRQALDSTAAGCVRIMEKNDRLAALDIETNLCVMILMLQAANRQTKETLKMFQDRGNILGFFPDEGEQQVHRAMHKLTPNLEVYDGFLPLIKDSLGNAMRIIRPLIVLDEGHRATTELAFQTLYGFNPCFVLELTATPRDTRFSKIRNSQDRRHANVLVNVTGRDLDKEDMIKMPINLDSRQGNDWKVTLNVAIKKLDELNSYAKKFNADSKNYIRPIMLVQVERTGTEQRGSDHIHAEDVKEWFLRSGIGKAEIAIKTSERNDLKQPENMDLMSPTNRVRIIITKQALQEGWDCPFAYVLCTLAASSNLNSLTQLVGRILRQPNALKTGVKALDECYVISHHASTAKVVEAIKKGLQQDGLDDLMLQVAPEIQSDSTGLSRQIKRRSVFTETPIYLPKVMILENNNPRELDYETDILARIDWRGFDPTALVDSIPENVQVADNQLRKIRLAEDGKTFLEEETVSKSGEFFTFDTVHAVRMISDIVLNPFVGREIVGKMLDGLRRRNFDETKLGRLSDLIIDEIRRGLDNERTHRAERFFKKGVDTGLIQFRLRVDGNNWQMPDSINTNEAEYARQLISKAGSSLERSLFLPIYENEFNSFEREVAIYLDAEDAITWWHRNVARTQYGIQGWKKAKIYPDFIFAFKDNGKASRITVLETKGDHLDNLDTEYKRKLLNFLSDNFEWNKETRVGELELVQENGDIVQCELILMSEWKTKLPQYLRKYGL